MNQNNKIIEECYKLYKKNLNKEYYKVNRQTILRKVLLKRLCRMDGKIKAATLSKYKVTEEDIHKISVGVQNAVKNGEVEVLGYDKENPKAVIHAISFVETYFDLMKARLRTHLSI